MSNAAFTNNFPNLFKNVSQKLFQPTGIAVLASVGIHAALGVSLPYLTVASKEKPQKGTVQLVKLSPTEQSRIPQLSPSSIPNQLGSLYPLPPGLSTPYPPLTSSSGLPSNWSPSPLNGLANNKRSQSTTSTSVISSTPPLKSPKTNQSTQSTNPKSQQSGKNYAITTGPTRIQGLTNRRDIPSLGLSPAQLPPPAQPPLPPPLLYPPSSGNEPILQARSNSTTTTNSTSPTSTPLSTTNSTPTPLASPSTAPTTNNPGATRSLSSGSTTIATAPSTALPALPGSPPQTPAPSKTNTTNNSTGTSNDDYQRRTIAALANMGQVEKLERYATVPGDYPKAACVEKLSGTSIVTAQVDGQGTVGDITVTVPSNSPIFDNVAQIAVSGINFGVKGKPIAYQVPVEFKYDSKVCGSASVPKNSAQPQSTATPQDAPAPKKSPEAYNVPTTQDTPAPKKSPQG